MCKMVSYLCDRIHGTPVTVYFVTALCCVDLGVKNQGRKSRQLLYSHWMSSSFSRVLNEKVRVARSELAPHLTYTFIFVEKEIQNIKRF